MEKNKYRRKKGRRTKIRNKKKENVNWYEFTTQDFLDKEEIRAANTLDRRHHARSFLSLVSGLLSMRNHEMRNRKERKSRKMKVEEDEKH
jgi:hypothetical protein